MRPDTRGWRLVLLSSLWLTGCPEAVERDIDEGNEARLTQRLASPEGQETLAARGDRWLERAVQAGQAESVEALLSAGAPLPETGAEGRALLSLALTVEDVRAAAGVLRALVRHGVRPTTLDAQGRTALHEALALRRPLLVRELLVLWPDVEDFDARPERLLVQAAEMGELESVQLLVGAGGVLEDAALLSAPLAPDLARVLRVAHLRFLVEDAARRAEGAALRELRAGTVPEVWDALGLSPAHLAVLAGDVPALTAALREEGSRLEAVEARGLTPLHLAARLGGPRVVEALVRAGADVDARAPGGRTPLLLAAHAGREEGVRALLAGGAAVNAEDELGESALSLAARAGHPAVVERLLTAGALLVRERPRARAASEPLKEMLTRAHARFRLRWAVEVGARAEEVRLRRAGATAPPVPGTLDAMPYVRAVLAGEPGTLESLAASHPEDLERLLRPRAGRTLLHWAALGGSVASAAWLLERGAALEAREPATPLGLALEAGHLGVAALLVERGAGWEGEPTGPASPERERLLARARNNAALAAALRDGRLEALGGLLVAGAGGRGGGGPGLAPGTLNGRILRGEALGALTRRELAAVGPDAGGATPLHYAAAAGNTVAVEKVLALGAAVSPRDKAGVTPLGYAARAGAAEAVRRLLAAGASALEPARPGTSALAAALCAPHPEAAVLLLARAGTAEPLAPECVSRALYAALGGAHEADALVLLGAFAPAGPEDVLALAREAAGRDRPGVLGALLSRPGGSLTARLPELLEVATRAGATESVALLLEREPDEGARRLQEVAREALVAGRSEVAMLAVERGADPLARQRESAPGRLVGATREHPGQVSLVGLALALEDEAFLETVRTRRPEAWTLLREDLTYFPLAVRGGQLALARRYVELGANLLGEDATGAPLLGVAGSVEMATWLFEQGAILEPPPPLDESTEPTEAPETPFIVAVARRHFDVGGFFLSRGARARVEPVFTALDARPAEGKEAEALGALLRERAWTAAQRGVLVEGLAERGCDTPALLEAALTGLSPADVAERTDAALVRLMRCEDPRSLEVLVRRGANPRAVDAGGRDVLTRALRAGRAPGARALLALGVKPLADRGDPFAPVWLALEGGQEALAREMLELGLKEGPGGRALDAPQRDTALALALRARAWTLAARLLAEGARVRVTRGEGPLALALAPGGGGVWMAALFLAMGGTDPAGEALKALLARGELTPAARLLREGRVPVDVALEGLLTEPGEELLRGWTRRTWEVLSGEQRERLLWLAVERDDVELATFLLERARVDVALRDGAGRSLLQRAAAHAGRRLVETLVDHGARLEGGTAPCPSALEVARGREDRAGRELARWLETQGAGGCGGP